MKKSTIWSIVLGLVLVSGIALAGSYTTHLHMYKPTAGENGWANTVNVDNWDNLDSTINTLNVNMTAINKLTTKGDLLSFNATAPDRLGVGANGLFLKSDSTTTTGIKWGIIAEADLTLADVATANTSTVIHGFAPKLSGNSTEFLNGAGAWSGTSAPYVKVSDVKANTVGGGTAVASTWTARDINTEDNDANSIASLSSNRVTLPAGTYEVIATAPFYTTYFTKMRLQNITAGTTLIIGTGVYLHNTYLGSSVLPLVGRFTLASTSALELQYFTSNGAATVGLGVPISSGMSEVYAVMEFRKVN
jgi:hypothetical protein